MSIDNSNLLFICHELRENLHRLDKTVKLTKLRFEGFQYQSVDSAFKLFESMIELGTTSRMIVQLISQLDETISSSSPNSLDYHIAAQQLNYFTCEWQESYLPRLRKLCEFASQSERSFFKTPTTAIERADGWGQAGARAADESVQARIGDRLQDALLRLEQSITENDKLITIISANIESTRKTIDAIHQSLDVSREGLDLSNVWLGEAAELRRKSNWWISLVVCTVLGSVFVLVLLAVRLLGIV